MTSRDNSRSGLAVVSGMRAEGRGWGPRGPRQICELRLQPPCLRKSLRSEDEDEDENQLDLTVNSWIRPKFGAVRHRFRAPRAISRCCCLS